MLFDLFYYNFYLYLYNWDYIILRNRNNEELLPNHVRCKKYLGKHAYKRLITSHHKHLNHGDYLIDDREKNGADKFVGELILFGGEKFPDWKSVISYLIP